MRASSDRETVENFSGPGSATAAAASSSPAGEEPAERRRGGEEGRDSTSAATDAPPEARRAAGVGEGEAESLRRDSMLRSVLVTEARRLTAAGDGGVSCAGGAGSSSAVTACRESLCLIARSSASQLISAMSD